MIINKIKKCNQINIIQNRHIKYNYYIKNELEAGIVLQGWEVKSIRSYQINIVNSYVIIKNNEAYLFNALFQPMVNIDSNIKYQQSRIKKLLLKKRELMSIINDINKKNYTIVPISLYWKKSWVKVKIGIAKGKKEHEKRYEIEKREWLINKKRIIKNSSFVKKNI